MCVLIRCRCLDPSEERLNMTIVFKENLKRGFPAGPVVKTSPPNLRGVGSIPGQSAKIPHASQPKNQKRK